MTPLTKPLQEATEREVERNRNTIYVYSDNTSRTPVRGAFIHNEDDSFEVLAVTKIEQAYLIYEDMIRKAGHRIGRIWPHDATLVSFGDISYNTTCTKCKMSMNILVYKDRHCMGGWGIKGGKSEDLKVCRYLSIMK